MGLAQLTEQLCLLLRRQLCQDWGQTPCLPALQVCLHVCCCPKLAQQ